MNERAVTAQMKKHAPFFAEFMVLYPIFMVFIARTSLVHHHAVPFKRCIVFAEFKGRFRNECRQRTDENIAMAGTSRQIDHRQAAGGFEFFAQKAALFSFNKLETGGFYFSIDPDAAEAGAGSDSQNVLGAFGQ